MSLKVYTVALRMAENIAALHNLINFKLINFKLINFKLHLINSSTP